MSAPHKRKFPAVLFTKPGCSQRFLRAPAPLGAPEPGPAPSFPRGRRRGWGGLASDLQERRGTGMAGAPFGGELLQGEPRDAEGWLSGGERGAGSVWPGKGHPRKQDLRKACPVKGEGGGGGTGGSSARERIFWEGYQCRKEPSRIWISGDKGSPWNRPLERPGEGLWGAQEVGTSAIGALEDWTGRKMSTDPFSLLQVLLGSLVPPTLPRRHHPQSPLVSPWRR